MSNVLSEEKQKQVIALGQLGWSLRRIEQSTGVRRETAAGYLREAGVEMRRPRGRRLSGSAKAASGVTAGSECEQEAKAASEVTTGLRVSQSLSAAHTEAIEEALGRGRNAKAIWQDLVDLRGFTGSYESVKRYVRQWRGQVGKEACAVIETEPGEEVQVDYGTGPMVRDPETGKYRRTRLFVLTLGYSRKSVRLLTWTSSTRTWCELHETAFRRLGGAVAVVVLDNLREGVLKPDIYDPALNPLFSDMLKHYGVVALPCRVRDPDRKGKVESAVGHAQKTPLRGQRFETLEQAQEYLDRWEARWADMRIHGTTKRQVAAMFAEEKPFLRALPLEPFRYYRHGQRTVHLDGCVEVEAAYYSAPPGWVAKRVDVQWDGLNVRLLNPGNGQLLREHLRAERGRHRIGEQDRPKHAAPSTLQLLSRARTAGKQIGVLAEAMYQARGETSIRRIQGLLAMPKRYGLARVEQACHEALELGVREYHFVRRYLERLGQQQAELKHIDPLIRQLHLYRDLIAQRSEEPNS